MKGLLTLEMTEYWLACDNEYITNGTGGLGWGCCCYFVALLATCLIFLKSYLVGAIKRVGVLKLF